MKTNRWRSRAGQSLVEMAMVLPLLAFLTFGLLDFGRAYYFQVSITNAAREGARVGILNIYTGPQNPTCSTSNSWATCPVQTDAAIITAVYNELTYSGITPTSVTICPPHDSSGGRSEEHTSELQSHRDLHSFPTRRSSDLADRRRDHHGGLQRADLQWYHTHLGHHLSASRLERR